MRHPAFPLEVLLAVAIFVLAVAWLLLNLKPL